MAFWNLAHRGASSYAPENTLAAFYKAIETGANGIELDLRYTKDKVIVVIHDATVDRTTNSSGLVADFTWEQLRNLDAGSWFSPKYKGERMVTFKQFLHYFSSKPLSFAVELKERGLEDEVCGLLHEHQLANRCTVTSFDFDILKTVRSIDSQMNIGFLTQIIDQMTIERIVEINGQQICPHAEKVTADAVRLAKASGLTVRAWGVKNEELMQHAYHCKVDGMTINFPDKLEQLLSKEL